MLDAAVRQLVTEPNIAAVTTLLPGGEPMTHPMWIDCDDDHLLINTEVHRQKTRNLRRDPRVTIAVWDPQHPYRYAEVRGHVLDETTGPKAREHIDQLAQKYTGAPYRNRIVSERIVFRIVPERQRAT